MIEREAKEIIAAAQTSRAQKRLGEVLDKPGQEELRTEIVAVARRRGINLGPGAEHWPGKKLLRRAQGREAASRVRTNPIARDEGFICLNCGAEVFAHGRTARDHCPVCLYSLHVDIVPGDRAADCGGLLRPVFVEMRSGHPYLKYSCERCGAERVNQAILDGDVADDFERIAAISSRSDHGR